MRTLKTPHPTSEQLSIMSDTLPGIVLIRGAAGSGKTTTALLRLRQLTAFWLERRSREEIAAPVRVLVVTYNRTLRGYINELATQQIVGRANLDLEISTFAHWAKDLLPKQTILSSNNARSKILELGSSMSLEDDFLVNEVDYLLGRFKPDDIASYLDCKRTGRGNHPRMEKLLRRKLVNEVVVPFMIWKEKENVVDWNDLAVQVAAISSPARYDVIIADEVQDFTANQIRALMHFANRPSSITFVLDAAQRIYPASFKWVEAGVTVQSSRSHRLGNNHRNTKQICQFAIPLLDGLQIDDDGTMPNLDSCQTSGDRPLILRGKYNQQVAFVMKYIEENVDLSQESIAFLKPKGGQRFNYLEGQLTAHSYRYVCLTRKEDWPDGSENIALSTMHSAKGLEFDYVLS